MSDEMLTTEEAAKELGVKPNKVLRLIRKNKIKAEKKGWFWLIPQEEIDRLKAANA